MLWHELLRAGCLRRARFGISGGCCGRRPCAGGAAAHRSHASRRVHAWANQRTTPRRLSAAAVAVSPRCCSGGALRWIRHANALVYLACHSRALHGKVRCATGARWSQGHSVLGHGSSKCAAGRWATWPSLGAFFCAGLMSGALETCDCAWAHCLARHSMTVAGRLEVRREPCPTTVAGC